MSTTQHCVYTRAYLDATTGQYEHVFIVRPPFAAALGTPAGVLVHVRTRALPPISGYKGHVFVASRDGCAQLLWAPKAQRPYYAGADTPDALNVLLRNGFRNNAPLAERLEAASAASAAGSADDGERLFLVGDFAA